MVKQYNLYNTEALFKVYLNSEKISAISLKNYLSDIRHFLGWLTFKEQSQIKTTIYDNNNIIGLISLPIIIEYQTYLIENNIPLRTVNRRLLTLRKFCSFCISQGWMKENPAKKIKNQVLSIKNEVNIKNKDITTQEKIIVQFEKELLKNKDKKQIETIINDIREFLNAPDININLSKPIIS